MSRVQEYLKRRKIEELGLPKIWVVKSERTGVSTPCELQVVEIVEGVAWRIDREERIRTDRYKVEHSPYEIDIEYSKKSTSIHGYGTGLGDLWGWTYYCTFSKEDANIYYVNEISRVSKKYENV